MRFQVVASVALMMALAREGTLIDNTVVSVVRQVLSIVFKCVNVIAKFAPVRFVAMRMHVLVKRSVCIKSKLTLSTEIVASFLFVL